MLYLSGTWFITQSTPYTKPVWWLPACSQACSFLVRCSYALGTMHDSKFGVGGVFRCLSYFCVFSYPAMHVSECFNDHMHVNFFETIFENFFENFGAFKVNRNVVYGCVP